MANPIAGAIRWLSRRRNRDAAGAVVGVVREVFSKPKRAPVVDVEGYPPAFPPLNTDNPPSGGTGVPPVDLSRVNYCTRHNTFNCDCGGPLPRVALAELRIRELEEDARHHRERAYRLEAGLRTLRYELCEEKYCACCRHFKKVILHALDGAT